MLLDPAPTELFANPIALLAGAAAAVASCQVLGCKLIASGFLPDAPNDRSSHSGTTPRSGGIAIFVSFLIGTGVAVLVGGAELGESSYLLAALAIAALAFLLGLLDDRAAAGPGVKFWGQFLVAVLFVAIAEPLRAAPLWTGDADLGVIAWPLSVLWIVAVMNAFNFMDGVNGIASACGALVLTALALASFAFDALFWAALAALFAASLAAFLPLNFPAGKIFMGDSGSQSAGFIIAASSLGAANASDARLAILMPIALTPFLADVAFTLIQRGFRRQNLVAAHRDHAYQLLVRMGWRHEQSTALFIILTLLSCALSAFAVTRPAATGWTITAANAFLNFVLMGAVFATARARGILNP